MRELLNEWNKFLITEIKAKEFKRLLIPDYITEDEYFLYVFDQRKNKFKNSFLDNDYLQIVCNSFLNGTDKNLEFFSKKEVYDEVNEKALVPFRQHGQLLASASGKKILIRDLNSQTYENLIAYINLKKEENAGSNQYQNLLDSRNTKIYEIVFEDSEWIFTLPKTTIASIALAKSFWNGEKIEYDSTFRNGTGENIGQMRWCTSIADTNNMFNHYREDGNSHMVYCINKNPKSTTDSDRKLCISFSKDGSLQQDRHTTVDGDNISITLNKIIEYIGQKRFDALKAKISNTPWVSAFAETTLQEFILLVESYNAARVEYEKEKNRENSQSYAISLNNIIMNLNKAENCDLFIKHIVESNNKELLEDYLGRSRRINSNFKKETYLLMMSVEGLSERSLNSIFRHCNDPSVFIALIKKRKEIYKDQLRPIELYTDNNEKIKEAICEDESLISDINIQLGIFANLDLQEEFLKDRESCIKLTNYFAKNMSENAKDFTTRFMHDEIVIAMTYLTSEMCSFLFRNTRSLSVRCFALMDHACPTEILEKVLENTASKPFNVIKAICNRPYINTTEMPAVKEFITRRGNMLKHINPNTKGFYDSIKKYSYVTADDVATSLENDNYSALTRKNLETTLGIMKGRKIDLGSIR